MKKLNKRISLIAMFILLLLVFSINFNDLANKSNFGTYIGILGLITFILVKSKK